MNISTDCLSLVLNHFSPQDYLSLCCVSHNMYSHVLEALASFLKCKYSFANEMNDKIRIWFSKKKKMTQKCALEQFRVSMKVLATLSHDSVPNRKYSRHAPDTKLFSFPNIAKACLGRFSSFSELDKYNEKLRLAREEKIRNQEELKRQYHIQYQKRKRILIGNLLHNDLSFREDSKLCEKFMESGTPTIQFVVKRMKQVNDFFNKFNGRQLIYRYRQDNWIVPQDEWAMMDYWDREEWITAQQKHDMIKGAESYFHLKYPNYCINILSNECAEKIGSFPEKLVLKCRSKNMMDYVLCNSFEELYDYLRGNLFFLH